MATFFFVLCRFSPALDADLRFALDNRPSDDIIRRCLVYVHKVVNAKGDREGRQMHPQPQSEVIYYLFMSIDLFVTKVMTFEFPIFRTIFKLHLTVVTFYGT